ncbi:hypothetical protein UR09_05485 [Candidatus Nitromaritima sp. SCGC AAA799-A02]|nr:hypothetical protein UZ36_07080 [Candidatus Nitromaritima sp. SCGC AAA799-C22]KMP10679.1 hypothetical protein UR09_05485 [Candidatus Nitromaritima sp. SCGC AAA799-A02]
MPTRADLAKIHIAKKELQLTDGLYRNLLFVLFKKKSARDLTPVEAEELILHFKSLGCLPGIGNRGGRPNEGAGFGRKYDDLGIRKGMATPAQLRLIEALWMTGPGVRIKTVPALRHFIKHYFHVSDLRFIKKSQVKPILGAIRGIGHPARKRKTKPTSKTLH